MLPELILSEPRKAFVDDHPMEPIKPMQWMEPMKPRAPWWPSSLGEYPDSSGGQNDARYAFFSDQQRLAVDAGDGRIVLYETGDLQISGVQQHQSGSERKLTFTSQRGEVDLEKLRRL